MTKFINKYTEAVFKWVVVALCSGIIYLLIDMRDFKKFIYPTNEDKRTEQIRNISEMQQIDRQTTNEKNSVVNKRIDGCLDEQRTINKEIKEINRKLDLVLYKLSLTYTAYEQ